MDSYQPIYDAVRSKISNGDVGAAVADAARSALGDLSYLRPAIVEEVAIACGEVRRPSVLFRPALSADGSMWCALYGEDLMNGIAGFGETAEEAMRAFDKAWLQERTPRLVKAESAV